jgi:hypothetical protein
VFLLGSASCRTTAPTTNTHSVPHLAELKKACATQIWEYRSCLEANGAESDDVIREKCGDKLKALWECTEAKVAEFDKK